MKRFLIFFVFCHFQVSAQFYYTQYFDGNDTSAFDAILIQKDSSSIWHIAPPQKQLFDSAATAPNAILTDSVLDYPINTIDYFSFDVDVTGIPHGVWAIQWKQMLDFEANKDGGLIEYSLDNGSTWVSIFNNPYVYNFFGPDPQNIDTVANGETMFTGTDSTWKDIWLCLDGSFLLPFDTINFRYTIISDSVDSKQEGWLIDDMVVHPTFVHTINENKQDKYIKVFPTISKGRVNISTEKIPGYHIIEEMTLTNAQGQVVRTYGRSPVKFYIDIDDLPDGRYYLKVKTNIRTEVLPVILNRD